MAVTCYLGQQKRKWGGYDLCGVAQRYYLAGFYGPSSFNGSLLYGGLGVTTYRIERVGFDFRCSLLNWCGTVQKIFFGKTTNASDLGSHLILGLWIVTTVSAK